MSFPQVSPYSLPPEEQPVQPVPPVPPSPVAEAAPVGRVGPGTNGTAIASLVLALCGLAILPVVLGHVALGQIRRSGQDGTALAVAGLVLGYLELVAYTLLIVLPFLLFGGAVLFGT